MVRRTLPAIPNLPIPVDVDGGLLPIPDVLVELRLELPARVSLHVARLITAPRRMPLRVEVVADPPTGGGDDLRVAFGYDALAGAEPGTRGEAPARFTAGLGFRIGEKLPDDAGTRSVLEPTITTAAAGDRLDLIAAVAISGSDPQRIAARAPLVPPPRLLALTVTDTCEAGTRTTDAQVDTDRETVVSGDVTVIRDGVRRDLHGRSTRSSTRRTSC